jgi:choline kinase
MYFPPYTDLTQAQFGNILRLENQAQLAAPDQRHRQLIVIDFEYAAPNPRAYDLANHFCEWMYNYHSPTSYLPSLHRYPSGPERQRFLSAYVAHGPAAPESGQREWVAELEIEVREWRPLNHVFWCVWGVIMSGDAAVPVSFQGPSASDFDYVRYADEKMRLFWGELRGRKGFEEFEICGREGRVIIE